MQIYFPSSLIVFTKGANNSDSTVYISVFTYHGSICCTGFNLCRFDFIM